MGNIELEVLDGKGLLDGKNVIREENVDKEDGEIWKRKIDCWSAKMWTLAMSMKML